MLLVHIISQFPYLPLTMCDSPSLLALLIQSSAPGSPSKTPGRIIAYSATPADGPGVRGKVKWPDLVTWLLQFLFPKLRPVSRASYVAQEPHD